MDFFKKLINNTQEEKSETPKTYVVDIEHKDDSQDILKQYIEYNKIEHDDNFIYVYKAVDINGCSFYDPTYKYELNKLQTIKNFDGDIYTSCAAGIHALPKNKAIDYGISQCRTQTATVYYKGTRLSVPTKENTGFKLLKLKIDKNKVIIPRQQRNYVSYDYGYNSSLPFNIDCKIRASEALVVNEEVISINQDIQFAITKIEYDYNNNNYKFYYNIKATRNNDIATYIPKGGLISSQMIAIDNNAYNESFFISDKLELSKEEIQKYLEKEYEHIMKLIAKQKELVGEKFNIN